MSDLSIIPREDPILRELIEEISIDTGRFIEEIFPVDQTDQFELPMTSMHKEIIELIDGPDEKVCILAPRGIGKTSLLEAYMARNIIYRASKFIFYISASQTHAETQTENAKMTLLTNPNIKALFPGVRVSDDDSSKESFSRKSWVAYGDTLVVPRGSGQQVRGARWKGGVRPDLIIIDDLENDELVMSEEQREKMRKWFFGALLKCTSPYKKSKIVYIDTLRHEDAVPTYLEEAEGWTFRSFAACDENMKSLIPEFWSQEKIDRDYADHEKAETLDEFYREMLNIPVSPQTATFRSRYFKYYEESDLLVGEAPHLSNIVILDPASTTTSKSDYSAIAGVGVSERLGCAYIRDCFCGRVLPDVLYKELLEMCRRIGSRTIAVEVTSLNEFILQPLKQYLTLHRAWDIEIIELRPRAKKEDRIGALVAMYRMGLIYHNRTCCQALEAQLLSWPRGKHDDMPDAVAYIMELFELAKRYLLPEVSRVESDEYDEPIDLMEHEWELCGGIFG